MIKIFVLTSIFVASLAQAQTQQIQLILNPTQSQIADALELVRQRPEVQGLVPVFSRSEQKALNQFGENLTSQTFKFYVRSEAELDSLSRFVKIQHLPFKIDRNSLAVKFSGGVSAKEQWGLKNIGEPQPFFMDRYTTINIPGRVGEDIGKAKEIPSKSGKKVVAVLDSGVAVNHPFLTKSISHKPKECEALAAYDKCLKSAVSTESVKGKDIQTKDPAKEKLCHDQYANFDSDGNGYPLDCEGWNFLDKNDFPNDMGGTPFMSDDVGHGTHVAGIIAAQENPQGIKGCTQNALILPVRVIEAAPRAPVQPQNAETPSRNQSVKDLPSPKEGDLKWGASFGDIIARGLLYAIRNNVDVINMSLGWPEQVDSDLVRRLVALAQARGIVVVAAAGNDSTDALIMPCVYPGVICVGASSSDGSIAHFSNFGSGVDIAAPGLRILSTYPMDNPADIYTDLAGYEFMHGTSQAAPFGACGTVDLLGQNFSPNEVYARLMLGVRPHQMSTLRNEQVKAKFTLSGNMDIDRSIALKPQPFISISKKEPISALWDGKSTTIPFSVELKNFWQNAGSVSVSVSLGDDAHGIDVAQGAWTVANWPSGVEKSFSGQLSLRSMDIPSEITMTISVSVENGPARRIPTQAVVVVNVTPEFANLGAVRLPMKDFKLKSDPLAVTPIEGDDTADYVLIERAGKKQTIKLLKEVAGQYQIGGEIELDDIGAASIKQVQKVDLNLDGKLDYVLIYRVADPDPAKRTFSFLFVFVDENFKPILLPVNGKPSYRMDYPQKTAALPPEFQWVKSANGNYRIPAWVAVGLRPEDKKPDPWKLAAANRPVLRLFYIENGELGAISEIGEYAPIINLPPSPSQFREGVMPVLLGKSNGYEVQYQMAEFKEGKITNVKALPIDRFRNLIGEKFRDINAMDSRHRGNSFVSGIGNGKARVTWLNHSGEFVDKILEPLNKTDAVNWVSGAFWGDRTQAVFAQTHHEMQYHDLISGTVKTTSMNRYSFMPIGNFVKIFFPVTVQDERLGENVPGMYIPARYGISPSSMVMVPRYVNNGQLVGLERPARLRFLAAKGCVPIEDQVVSEARKSTELVFYCGSTFIRIPLKF